MIKRNAWKFLLIIAVVLIYLGYMHFSGRARYLNVNIHSTEAHPLNQEVHFNADQVVSIFKKNNIQMTEEKNTSSQYDLNGVHPKIYELNQNKQYRVFLYIFNSLKDRKKVSQQIEASFGSPFSKGTGSVQHPAYVYGSDSSWNVLFLEPFSTTIKSTVYKNFPKLEPIIFKDMNDGKTRIYKGQTPNWSTTFTYNYFSHWYKNASGFVVNDGEGNGTFDITYNGKNLPIHNVYYGFQLPSENASEHTQVLSTRNVSMTYSSQSDVFKSTVKPMMTYQWDQKKESTTLQPQ